MTTNCEIQTGQTIWRPYMDSPYMIKFVFIKLAILSFNALDTYFSKSKKIILFKSILWFQNHKLRSETNIKGKLFVSTLFIPRITNYDTFIFIILSNALGTCFNNSKNVIISKSILRFKCHKLRSETNIEDKLSVSTLFIPCITNNVSEHYTGPQISRPSTVYFGTKIWKKVLQHTIIKQKKTILRKFLSWIMWIMLFRSENNIEKMSCIFHLHVSVYEYVIVDYRESRLQCISHSIDI